MNLPEHPNKDGWISFVPGDGGEIHLRPEDRFVLTDMCARNPRAFDPAAIGYFPPHLKKARDYGDGGLMDLIFAWRPNPLLDVQMGLRTPAEAVEFLSATPAEAQKRLDARTLSLAKAWLGKSADKASLPPEPSKMESITDRQKANQEARAEVGKLLDLQRQVFKGKHLRELKELRSCSLEFDLGRLLALGGGGASDHLAQPEHQIAVKAAELLQRARDGDVEAANRYVHVLILMIEQLQQLEKDAPDVYRKLPEWRLRWPALLSNHPYYAREGNLPETLSKGYQLTIDKSTRWKPDNDVTQVALQLVLYLHRLRLALKDFLGTHSDARPDAFLAAVRDLGELTHDEQKWWKCVLRVFVETYPRADEVERFKKWVTAKSHKKTPGVFRARITETLRSAFFSLAGYTQRNTSEPQS